MVWLLILAKLLELILSRVWLYFGLSLGFMGPMVIEKWWPYLLVVSSAIICVLVHLASQPRTAGLLLSFVCVFI